MDKFIQKLNFGFVTNQRIMQLIASIDEYRGKWNVVEKRESRYLKELRKTEGRLFERQTETNKRFYSSKPTC
jgi:hypothetical protein